MRLLLAIPRADRRCDRCSAEARVLAFRDSLTLLFCGHHYERHEPALAAGGWSTDDHRIRYAVAAPTVLPA